MGSRVSKHDQSLRPCPFLELNAVDTQLKQLINEIHAKYSEIANAAAGVSLPSIEVTFGNLERDKNDAPPKVNWICGNGQFDPGKGTGYGPLVESGLGTLVPRCLVWIWGVDDQACWDIARTLFIATRRVALGPNTHWREWQEPTEGSEHYMEHGSVLILTVDLDLKLSAQVTGERMLRTVLGHTHDVSLLQTRGDQGSNPLPPLTP